MKIVTATPDMLKAFYGEIPKKSCRALAAVHGGDVYGVCGYYMRGDHGVLFSDMSDRMRNYPKQIVIAGNKLMEIAHKNRIPLISVADECVAQSERFLSYLGFTKTDRGVFLWLP